MVNVFKSDAVVWWAAIVRREGGRGVLGEEEWWGGGGRKVLLHTCVCSFVCMHASDQHDLVRAHQTPRLGCQPVKNPYAYSLPRQVPGVPDTNLNQPQGEEKGAEVRPPHPPTPEDSGAATFSIALTLEALGLDHDQYHEHPPLDVISWSAGPVQKQRYHYYHHRW